MFRLSLRRKLMFFAIAIAIVPLVVAGRTMIRIAQDELKSSANEQLSSTAQQLTGEINDLYERTWLAPLLLIRNAVDSDELGVQEKVALLTLGVGMVHVAETRIDSGVAAMIAGSVPLQIVLMRRLVGEQVPRATAFAAVVGLAGLALVVGPGGFGGGSEAIGLLVMLSASISWALGSFAARTVRLPSDAFVASVACTRPSVRRQTR